jgi:MFS family permease
LLDTAPVSPLNRLAAALTYRDFRVLWMGAMTSSIGTWMQKVAQNWLVLTLAGASSAFYLGLDSFLGELPILLFTLIGGVVADRYDRRRLLLTSQYVQMTTAFTLAVLVYFDVVRIWHVLILSAMTGCAQAFGGPAHQSLMPLLIDKQHLPNAVALNSIQFNLARVIGPLLAGAALTAFGMVACFGLNGLSFLAVIAALLSLHVRHIPVPSGQRMRDELKGGLRYVRAERALVNLTVIGFATTFLGLPLLTFLPLFAQNVFKGGVAQYTHLMAFAGGGAVTGALVAAWLGKFPHMGRALLVIQFAFGAMIVAFAASRVLWTSELLLFVAGALMVMTTAMTMSLVQLNAPNEMRGRVMSIYMVAFRGGMPLGSLLSGWAAHLTSAPTVLFVNGVLLACVAGWFLIHSHGVREL